MRASSSFNRDWYTSLPINMTCALFATLSLAWREADAVAPSLCSSGSELVPAEDVVIHGHLVLSLPKARRLKSIHVKVVQHYNLSFPDLQYESGQQTVSEASVLQNTTADRLFDVGDHTFRFSLTIPSSTAPYDLSQYGRIYYELVACTESDSMFQSNIIGRAPVRFIVNPAPIGETLGLDAQMHGFNEELGSYAISATTQHVTVGGLVAVCIVIPQTLRRTHIISVSAHVDAYYSLTSVSGHTKTLDRRHSPVQHATKHSRVFSIMDENVDDHHCHSHMISETRNAIGEVMASKSSDGVLGVVDQGGSYHLNNLTRLPHDDVIRPSTMPGTITPIQVQHELSVTVTYQVKDDSGILSPVHTLKSSAPVTISSCCCQLSSILLPEYSEFDPLHDSASLSPIPSTSSKPTTSRPSSSIAGRSIPPSFHSQPHPSSSLTKKPKPLRSAHITDFLRSPELGSSLLCVCLSSKEELIALQKIQNDRIEEEWKNGHVRLLEGIMRRQTIGVGNGSSARGSGLWEGDADGQGTNGHGKFEFSRVGLMI